MGCWVFIAAGFSDVEANDPAIQMKVRRSKEYKGKKAKGLPAVIQNTTTPLPISRLTATTASIPTASSSTSSVSTNKQKNKLPPLPKGAKKIRRTAIQSQQGKVNKKIVERIHKVAHKKATKWFEEERVKEDGVSAQQIADSVNSEFDVALNARTIQRYVKDGRAGESPLKSTSSDPIPVPDRHGRFC